MSLDPISAVADAVSTIIDRFVPDPAQAAQAKLQFAQLQQAPALAQINVDQAEAASPLAIAHWRDGAGWVCVLALAYQFFLAPVLTWAMAAAGHPTPAPTLDTGPLLNLMLGMLGLGGMHLYQTAKR